MIILFSPSESKHIIQHPPPYPSLQLEHLTFLGEDPHCRKHALQNYITALHSQDEACIHRLFGTKQIHLDTLSLSQNLFNTPCIEAIRLYDGVAYEALEFEQQNQQTQQIILGSTIIFSNLFGPIKADDLIPFYRLKQGSFIGNLKQYYANFKTQLDEYCHEQIVIDLRAEFYQKLYTPKAITYRPFFYKNNQRLSHYAKMYRGNFLKQIARVLSTQKLSDPASIAYEGLILKNIKQQKNVIELEYDIDA